MAVSKHVEEALDSIRRHTLVAVSKSGIDIPVLEIDPYPEETNNVISLGNGKKITTDDLEFCDIIFGESQIKIHLGEYTFHIQRGKCE
jgi:hypothetical protein